MLDQLCLDVSVGLVSGVSVVKSKRYADVYSDIMMWIYGKANWFLEGLQVE